MFWQTGSNSFTDPQFIFVQRLIIKEVSFNFIPVAGIRRYFDQ